MDLEKTARAIADGPWSLFDHERETLYKLVLEKLREAQGAAPTERTRPAWRRHGNRRKFVVHGVTCYATVNLDPAPTRELFLDGPKAGAPLDLALKDAGVLASLAIQYGCPPDALADALSYDPLPKAPVLRPGATQEDPEDRIERTAGSHVAAGARWLAYLVGQEAPPGPSGASPGPLDPSGVGSNTP